MRPDHGLQLKWRAGASTKLAREIARSVRSRARCRTSRWLPPARARRAPSAAISSRPGAPLRLGPGTPLLLQTGIVAGHGHGGLRATNYERRWRSGRRVQIAALLWLSAGAALHACPICFQVEDAATVNGVRAAVLVLFGVTAAVLGGVIAFARRVAARQDPGNQR